MRQILGPRLGGQMSNITVWLVISNILLWVTALVLFGLIVVVRAQVYEKSSESIERDTFNLEAISENARAINAMWEEIYR